MSIYCHLSCKKCRETLFVKDADSDAHVDRKVLGQFLEKHYHHPLIYTWEEESEKYDDESFDSSEHGITDEWPRFAIPEGGWWSHGEFYED